MCQGVYSGQIPPRRSPSRGPSRPQVGTSRVEADFVAKAGELLETAKAKGVTFLLPVDHVVAAQFPEAGKEVKSSVTPGEATPAPAGLPPGAPAAAPSAGKLITGKVVETMDAGTYTYVQVDDVLARRHGGTGLGLALTRRLCELLGGDISVDSALGQGSRFRVFLPHAP